MEEKKVIQIRDLSKMYKLYDKPSDRLKESLGLTKKKCYREHYALSHVSFDVHQGETVGIIGTNGSGKSTILKIITGVLSPTTGEVEVVGTISALLELGAGFNMDYTGIENIYMNGTMMGFSRKEMDEKLQDILDFADIGDFVYQPVKTYSSGMFVRLAFDRLLPQLVEGQRVVLVGGRLVRVHSAKLLRSQWLRVMVGYPQSHGGCQLFVFSGVLIHPRYHQVAATPQQGLKGHLPRVFACHAAVPVVEQHFVVDKPAPVFYRKWLRYVDGIGDAHRLFPVSYTHLTLPTT